MGVCNCSMFCCTLLYVHSSIAIILMGKRELVALLNLSSWCLVMFERLFLAVPRGCLRFVIVVSPDHTHLLFLRHLQNILISKILNRTVSDPNQMNTGVDISFKMRNVSTAIVLILFICKKGIFALFNHLNSSYVDSKSS